MTLKQFGVTLALYLAGMIALSLLAYSTGYNHGHTAAREIHLQELGHEHAWTHEWAASGKCSRNFLEWYAGIPEREGLDQ